MYFFLKTGKRYRPNSFFIVIYGKFVLGWTFFNFRSWSMTSSPYPVHVNLNIFNFEKYSHVIPQTSPNSLLSLVFILFCYSSALESRKSKFSSYWNIMKIHCENLMTSLWRNRSWPEAEKSSAQYKFSIDYNEKRIRSISLTSFEKKIQNCPPLKKYPP